MRNKIALIVALASFLAVTALGAAIAGADPLSDSTAVTPSAAAPVLPSPLLSLIHI